MIATAGRIKRCACGRQNPDEARFCGNCGVALYQFGSAFEIDSSARGDLPEEAAENELYTAARWYRFGFRPEGTPAKELAAPGGAAFIFGGLIFFAIVLAAIMLAD